MELMKKLINDEAGQGMTEYGLLLAVVVVAVAAALTLLNGTLSSLFTSINAKISTAISGL